MSSSVKPQSNERDRCDVWNAFMLKGCKYAGKYEIPVVPACNTIPERLIPYSETKSKRLLESHIHFFESDYEFECVWRTPQKCLPRIKTYAGAIAPDFSLFREMPLAEQIHSTFRSRALTYWWSKEGINVIPNVGWGDSRTYEFCFDGLPQNSVLAVGTNGSVKRKHDRQFFCEGFMVMLERLTPNTVIVYGPYNEKLFPPLFMHVYNVQIVAFKSDFIRSRLREVV